MKKTLWLLAGAVLLLVLILVLKKTADRMLNKEGFAYDTAQVSEVTALRVTQGSDTTNLVRRQGRWVTVAESFPANPLIVKRGLYALLGVRSKEIASEKPTPAQLEEYGLAPGREKIAEWTLASGRKARILLGKVSAADGSTYWKWEDKSTVYRTPGDYKFQVSAIENEWKDRHFYPSFVYENVQTVEVDWRDSLGRMEHYRIDRTSDTSARLTEPFDSAMPRTIAADVYEQTPQFTIDAFVAAGDTNAAKARLDSPAVLVRITLKNGTRYEVRSGGLFEGYHYTQHPVQKGLVKIEKWRFDFFLKRAKDLVNPKLAPPAHERTGIPEVDDPYGLPQGAPQGGHDDHGH